MRREKYTEEEWDTASERVRAVRRQVMAHPIAAAAESRTYDEITRRVESSARLPER